MNQITLEEQIKQLEAAHESGRTSLVGLLIKDIKKRVKGNTYTPARLPRG